MSVHRLARPETGNSKPLIRAATPADVPTLGRLGALLVQEHHDFDALRFLAPGARTREMYGSFLASRLADADAIVLVAEEDGRVIGYAFAALEGHDWMSLRGPAAVLHDLIVDPEDRGRGVGRLLLGAMLSHLESRGAPRVVLSTAERNEPARRLFQTMGFRSTMVEMTREIGPPPPAGPPRKSDSDD